MQPVPIPPIGIATCVAVSPLNVRCAAARRSSSSEYAAAFVSGEIALSAAELVGAPPKGIAAPNATEEEVTRNSRRVGFSEEDMKVRLQAGLQDTEPVTILNRSHKRLWLPLSRCLRHGGHCKLKEIHRPNVTSDLAREFQRADYCQGESGM